jgi:ABC-type Zn uptake system ZnuABC Zn-binding protein ZnuA
MSGLQGCRLAIASLLLIGFACGRDPQPERAEGRLLVLASILPLADFVRQVGGDNVLVSALVPPAASPHTFEPTPSQLRQVSRADILVLNGIGLEYWSEDILSAAENPDLLVVVASRGIELLEDRDHEHFGNPHEHDGGGNPHVWLSPRNAMHQVEVIRDALIDRDPNRSDAYRFNAASYLRELGSLDLEIKARVETFSSRRFIAYHAAWSYFARDYGLEQAAVVETTPGREPSPGEIASIIDTARSIGARAIFAEPQFSTKAADTIAEESGARVLFLNPLGVPPENRYIDLMRYNLAEISKALR